MFQRVPLSGALASSSGLRVKVAVPPAAPPLLPVPPPCTPRPSVPLSGAVASSSGAPWPGLLRVVNPPPVPGPWVRRSWVSVWTKERCVHQWGPTGAPRACVACTVCSGEDVPHSRKL